jgi:hypothetical protein
MFFSLHPVLIALTGLITIMGIAIVIIGSVECWHANLKLKKVLRTENDLQLVQKVARKNKFLAGIFIYAYIAYLLLIIAIDYLLNNEIGAVKICLGVNGYTILPFALLSFLSERSLKKLRVESDIVDLEERYKMLLLDWGKPGLKLKK